MLDAYLEQIRADAFDNANDPDNGGLRLDSLVRVLLDRLEEAGAFGDGHVAYYHRELPNLHAEVHAYCYDADDDVLSLFHCLDAHESTPLGDTWRVEQVTKEAVERGFRRLQGFVKLVQTGRADDLEESQPAAELVELVREALQNQRSIELHLLTTGTVSDRAAFFDTKDGLRREVWDLLRLLRTCGRGADERPSIDFDAEFNQLLPCLITPEAEDGVQVLLSCITGHVLAKIYDTYRARLLERNVRSFLQFTGKVNKGIRDTVLNNPERFLPYNNGLSATASKVDLVDIRGSLAKIQAVHDFQIVNGGQTTASIASCVRRDGADLSRVTVPMKLTIVPPERLDELVPLISKYANTQNRIQEADFSANHPWHIDLEKISRTTWTIPTREAPHGTRWFYERSRGQYADELAAQNTPAGRRRFRAENPPSQKFTKTDLAKYVLSWDERPAVVSRGAQKCFMEFMSQLGREGRNKPDAAEFRRIIGQAILFHTAERLYGELGFQGYRANVVTYSVARLSYALQRRIPWDDIWEQQALPAHLVPPMKIVLTGVRDVILHPPNSRNITEWCKREECWSAVLTLSLDLGLPDMANGPSSGGAKLDRPPPTAAEAVVIGAVKAVPFEVWFAVSKWAKGTQSLQAWQRGLAYSLGSLLERSREPSAKQAKQGCRLLLEARRLGFGHEGLTADLIERLGNCMDTGN